MTVLPPLAEFVRQFALIVAAFGLFAFAMGVQWRWFLLRALIPTLALLAALMHFFWFLGV